MLVNAPLLVMNAVKKSFDGIEVLKGVDFFVRSGEVHALVGENGAGKTTLMNLLAGVHHQLPAPFLLLDWITYGFQTKRQRRN